MGCGTRTAKIYKRQTRASLEPKRSGDPLLGDFSDAIVIKSFGEVPERLDEL
jgi:hypothetical protein